MGLYCETLSRLKRKSIVDHVKFNLTLLHFSSLKERIVFLMISRLSRSSFSQMVRGGVNLILSPWVGFAKTPFLASLRQTSQASISGLMTIALKSPRPRTNVTRSSGFKKVSRFVNVVCRTPWYSGVSLSGKSKTVRYFPDIETLLCMLKINHTYLLFNY